ncbi:Chromosome transmission fidelity protein 18 [Paramarasmius palmivorus]|uniref:Chromosome transmission fidelity protein 18 n=1 Tax=Paramarasmius palmivorus TaxID=297713 RepID=A0AAW0C599_9AGAR
MSAATASAFTPTGLLGQSQDAFTSTGLLSGSIPCEEDVEEKLDEGMVFKSTGLLGSSSSASNGNVTESSKFLSTGLLDLGTPDATAGSFLPTGLLSEAQGTAPPPTIDSELPSPEDIFGASSSKIPSHATPIPLVGTTSSRFSIKATDFNGKSFYIRKKPKTTERNKLAASSSSRKMGNLLDVPIHRLMDNLSAATAASMNTASTSSSTSKPVVEDTLWVDRYRPRKFTELMGNERVAREALSWVKQWDWCVFGKSKGKKRMREGDQDVYEDEYHRPKEKILLLSGPPGLGKTTLAHVVARQAGYEVLEINASDARSGQIVDDRIRPALEAGHAVKSSKPLLLVIDEIDGATGAGDNSGSFIHKLVQLTQGKARKKSRSGKKDPNAQRPILRPIICICNDINAASLAKLRPHAYQIRYQRPADVHTVKRLREICEIESLRADSRALSALVGIAQGDLRGCLNTLQFIKSKNEEVTESIIRGATKGMKESETSISSVLNSLFSPLSKKRAKELGMSDSAEARYVGRLSHEIDACGRESSIAIGCFAHYATLRRHDANFSRHEKANDWLLTFDFLSAAMYSDGDFALAPYIPYTLVPFYPLFQERGAPKVERDTTDWENLQTTRSNEEIYKSLARCLQTASTRHGGDYRHLGNSPIMQLEFAPMINRIISPQLRPVNSQLVRLEERAMLSRLVDIMSTLELRFVQERTEDGQLTYRLDPPIDVFITYDGKRAPDIPVSRYAVRHMVAEQVDARLSSQTEIVEKSVSGKAQFFGTNKSLGNETEASPSEHATSIRPNKRARVEPPTDIADKPPTDFFGRPIATPAAAKSSTNSAKRGIVLKETGKTFRVSYRYKEGNSAAVRKPVKTSAFT